MAKKVSGVRVGSGSVESAVSRGGAGGATLFLATTAGAAAGLARRRGRLSLGGRAEVAGGADTTVPAAVPAFGCVAAGTFGSEASTGGAAGTAGSATAGVAAGAAGVASGCRCRRSGGRGRGQGVGDSSGEDCA